MARKPTRFWHPARRLLVRARAGARSLIARREGAAKLDDIRPRLQHYLRAMYGHAVLIESLPPAADAGWAIRTLRTLALVRARAASESNAECIRLPAILPGQRTDVSPLEQYRVIAVQHAERIRRASARHGREAGSNLEQDLFQLAEAAAIDAQIIESQPGLRAALEAARAESMSERPAPRWRTEIELRVEEMVRRAWLGTGAQANGDSGLPQVPLDGDAEANATWARRTANTLEAKYGRKAALEYRRVPEITLWQTSIRTQLPEEQEHALETEMREGESAAPPKAQSAPSRSAMPGPSQSRSSQQQQGGTPVNAESEKSSPRMESDKADGGGDSGEPSSERAPKLSDEGEAGEDSAGALPADGVRGEDSRQAVGHSGQVVPDAWLAGGMTFLYPEWDFNAQNFRATGTTVRVMPPSLASSGWATAMLHEHAREVHRAKRQFERLRSHRLRLRRQEQGDELDLEACVEAMVDRRMRIAPSDRLYSLVRPGRRELAITLLIDVSGSTSEVVVGEQRVIDIERIAALVAMAAFDALGDDYSILAFSSASASNVRVHVLKEFGEMNSALVHQRISALAPHGFTRLGAAVRHATAQLSNHPAPHRLLLILSDGKPHDYDLYFVDYAIQDSRQAVVSARMAGIHPFCITVDGSAPEGLGYLGEIFGWGGYRVVSRPGQLSGALLGAVQRMIGAG